MKKIIVCLSAVCLITTAFSQTTLINPQTDKNLLKTFQDAKLGLFVHLMACFTPATGDSWMIGRNTSKHIADSISYSWDPERIDPKAIVDFAVKAGCKYIVVIAKHHDGFCIWDSKYTDFNIKKTKFKRDILNELGKEAHKRGLLYGIYYSIGDIDFCGWKEIPTAEQTPPEPKGGKPRFVSFVHNQVRELINNYNPDILWFDGYWLGKYWTQEDGINLYNDIKRTKLATLSRGLSSTRDPENKHDIFLTNGASGDYLCIEAKTAEGPKYPWEACTSVSYPVYAYDPAAKLMTKKELITMFDKVVCGNGNFLLNIGPERDGSMPKPLTDRFMEMSDWVLKNKGAVYNVSGGPFKQGDWGGSTYGQNRIFLHIRQQRRTLSIKNISGYKILSATEVSTGRKLQMTKGPTGYTIEVPQLKSKDEIPIIALNLDKGFLFENWLNIADGADVFAKQ